MVSMVAGQCVGHAGAALKANMMMQTREFVCVCLEHDHASALCCCQHKQAIPACSLWSNVSVSWGQSSGVQLAHTCLAAWQLLAGQPNHPS